MAAAATEMGLRPDTISSSPAFLAICVAALCTELGSPKFEQNRDIKSAVVMSSTEVSSAFRMSLKHLPISFLLILLTAQISLNVRGTPSWRHAIYRQADAMASFARPFKFLPSWTCRSNCVSFNSSLVNVLNGMVMSKNPCYNIWWTEIDELCIWSAIVQILFLTD